MKIYLVWSSEPSSHDFYEPRLIDIFLTDVSARDYCDENGEHGAYIQERTLTK